MTLEIQRKKDNKQTQGRVTIMFKGSKSIETNYYIIQDVN